MPAEGTAALATLARPSHESLAACLRDLRLAVRLLTDADVARQETAVARDQALAALASATRHQQAFLTLLVAELKNPVAAIKGRAQVVARRSRRTGSLALPELLASLAEITALADRVAAELDAVVFLAADPPSAGDAP